MAAGVTMALLLSTASAFAQTAEAEPNAVEATENTAAEKKAQAEKTDKKSEKKAEKKEEKKKELTPEEKKAEEAKKKADQEAKKAERKAALKESREKYPWAFQTDWMGSMTGAGVYGGLALDPARAIVDARVDFALAPWVFADMNVSYSNALNSQWKQDIGTPASTAENLYSVTIGLGVNGRLVHAGYFNPNFYAILNGGIAYESTSGAQLSNDGLAFALNATAGMDVPLLTLNLGKKDKPFYISIDGDIHYSLMSVLDHGISHGISMGVHVTFPGTVLIGN